jgi:hypothetical protein
VLPAALAVPVADFMEDVAVPLGVADSATAGTAAASNGGAAEDSLWASYTAAAAAGNGQAGWARAMEGHQEETC